MKEGLEKYGIDVEKSNQPYDIIGDIHGHADELEALLQKMDYNKNAEGTYCHPDRKAFFVGDFIDKGPKIKQVLEIVKPMVEKGFAKAVIGNHEYNAICFHTEVNEKPLRAHTDKNIELHDATIKQVVEKHPQEWETYLEWFKTLPIFFENDNFRVVHAHWKEKHIMYLKAKGIFNFKEKETLIRSNDDMDPLHLVIEETLKGEEVKVPGVFFTDKYGIQREEYRIKWWNCPKENEPIDCLFEFVSSETYIQLNYEVDLENLSQKPVFFGHYWLKDAQPVLQKNTVCCLDYSVANEGYLVAYRWGGESELVNGNIVC
ncbi:MAG: metallophosphoesterase [Bacteroidetes bacterium]|nr:metallophosphoesterase [Bacteroidota bacterium]